MPTTMRTSDCRRMIRAVWEDPVDLFPVVGAGQIHPAGKLPAQALAVLQQLAGLGEPVQPRGEPVGRQERARVAHIKFKHKQTPLKLGI